MRIVTGSSPFIDIDAYGGIIAYAELLKVQDVWAQAVSTSNLNASINHTVLSWDAPLVSHYTPTDDDTFTVIDISNHDYLDRVVVIDRVNEVIDHHPGFEAYWQERLGNRAHIETVGAACTLVYERWKQANLLDRMSPTSARLLICGILDNTLNFGASITTPRDHEAHQALQKIAQLPDDWAAQYFSECQTAMLSNLDEATTNDMKPTKFPSHEGEIQAGQLVIWDPASMLQDRRAEIETKMETFGPVWFMNIVSIKEGKSYFLSKNKIIQQFLSDLLGVTFKDGLAVADRMWLRKEMVKQDLSRAKH